MPRKNIRPFAGRALGLLQLKLEQLLATRLVDRVLLSTNDQEILDYASQLKDSRMEVRERDDRLAASSTSTDELIRYVGEIVPEGDVLWTHVTSPFVGASVYDAMIERYLQSQQEGFDSLMAVTELRGFLWDQSGPVSYDRNVEKWPRTQTLAPLYEVNSAAFLAPSECYRASADRIGRRPFRYILDKVTGFDIDWEDDFLVAQALVAAGVAGV